MRLKEDASSWNSSGIIKRDFRHGNVKLPDEPAGYKSRKDKNKWCKGKKGVEHILRRYFIYYSWNNRRSDWIETKCIICNKEMPYKKNKDTSIPLIIPIDEYDDTEYHIPVVVNGKQQQIKEYATDRCYCGRLNCKYRDYEFLNHPV